MAHSDPVHLGRLALAAGEGARLGPSVAIEPLTLGGTHYAVAPRPIELRLDVSRLLSGGYALRLRFEAALTGACMRCLEPAEVRLNVDSREVNQPGEAEELDSPYVRGEQLDIAAWARDALALAAPVQLLCQPSCLGLCPECAARLDEVGPDHHHEPAPDPRWAKLRDETAD